MENYILAFHEGHRDMVDILGGKGANLAEMTQLKLPVPPGFTITTRACLAYLEEGRPFLSRLEKEIQNYLKLLEKDMGKEFGHDGDPLLLSVRSGASVSMPGMMDTILNLGLNDETVQGLIQSTGHETMALDCYRRLIQMYGEVVLGIGAYRFHQALERAKKQAHVELDSELSAEHLYELIDKFKAIIKEEGKVFPQDPKEQLYTAIEAVFSSWNNRRAQIYRQAHSIPHDLGTAVNIQAMVFGNRGDTSGTGVLFTRNPSTGAKELYGEFLINAQGEDVVAGTRTPQPLSTMAVSFSEIYDELENIAQSLEQHYRDMQDVEFTMEEGRLFILQTRDGKRTPQATIKIAVDMVQEGVLTEKEALLRVSPEALEKVLHRQLKPDVDYEVLAKGLPASPGAATGAIVLNSDEAERLGQKGEHLILVAPETTPDDIHGVLQAQGVLTARGGMTSHAAVVARGMGKPAVCGCDALHIKEDKGSVILGGREIQVGTPITINGSTGEVILGAVEMEEPELSSEAQKLLQWADEQRMLGVRANADNGEDAQKAREFGAEGIGLCRTEHMFMGRDRLPLVQKLILGETVEEREAALAALLPRQKEDFKEILEVMSGLPVNVRLLDPPLHEFLPDLLELQKEMFMLEREGREEEWKEKNELFRKARNLSETNPMLGFRGCRLGLAMPALYEMQVRALFQAGEEVCQEGKTVELEIMIPLIAQDGELLFLKNRLETMINNEFLSKGTSVTYSIGTMIELPRACLTADEIANHAAFFSFGTNDLTQTTYGFSRDDAEGKFLHLYLEEGILPENPFMSIDERGVGKLVTTGVELGRSVNENLKVGICGEHGGDPASIDFCHRIGLDYVSCSPYRVPVARLAAGQAAVRL